MTNYFLTLTVHNTRICHVTCTDGLCLKKPVWNFEDQDIVYLRLVIVIPALKKSYLLCQHQIN